DALDRARIALQRAANFGAEEAFRALVVIALGQRLLRRTREMQWTKQVGAGAIENVALGAIGALRRRRSAQRMRVADDVTERRDDAQSDRFGDVAAQPVPCEQDFLRRAAWHRRRGDGGGEQPRFFLQAAALQSEKFLFIRAEVED